MEKDCSVLISLNKQSRSGHVVHKYTIIKKKTHTFIEDLLCARHWMIQKKKTQFCSQGAYGLGEIKSN